MTTVAELIEELAAYPGDTLVVMSKDAEGNGYSPYSDMSLGWYTPECTWAGEFTGELLDWEDQPREVYADEVIALALWPVN